MGTSVSNGNTASRNKKLLALGSVAVALVAFIAVSVGSNLKASLAEDTSKPVISAANVAAFGANRVTIEWTTNEPADSRVQYCASGSCAIATYKGNATYHRVTAVTLPNRTYAFKILTKDAAGNQSVSAIASVKTSSKLYNGLTQSGIVIDFQNQKSVTGIENVKPGATYTIVNMPTTSVATLYLISASPDKSVVLASNIATNKITVTIPDTFGPSGSANFSLQNGSAILSSKKLIIFVPSLTVMPASVQMSEWSNGVKWTSQNATSCTGSWTSPPYGVDLPPNGTKTGITGSLATIHCRGLGGSAMEVVSLLANGQIGI